MATRLQAHHPASAVAMDMSKNLKEVLADVDPFVVIHTSGPFQQQDHFVAQACIEQGCHYIDLADARAFVVGIGALDAAAKRRQLLICSGASSVPCLTSSIIETYRNSFRTLHEVDYGIATAQVTNRGFATTSAILSYVGRAFPTLFEGEMIDVYGWQNLRRRRFDGLGWRFMGNCDVPDLALFPMKYPELRTVRFQASLEVPVLHLGLWLLSWLVRIGLMGNLERYAGHLLQLSKMFDFFGSESSGFSMTLKGEGRRGRRKQVKFSLVARGGDGLYIPCAPAIILAKKLARGDMPEVGAMPCVGLITLEEHLEIFEPYQIAWKVSGSQPSSHK